MTLDYKNLGSIFKLTSLLLNKEAEIKVLIYIKNRITVQNVSTYLQFSRNFSFLNISEFTFEYFDRFFTMVVENSNFLELDPTSISKILIRSDLYISSEIEVFNALDSWLTHDVKERKKFADDLILRVRLQLLTDHALKHILKKSSSLCKSETCVDIINTVIQNRTKYTPKNNINHTDRYCSHEQFNIIFLGGYDNAKDRIVANVHEIDVKNFKNVIVLPPMMHRLSNSKPVYSKGEVYVFGGLGCQPQHKFVVKYSTGTKNWEKINEMYDNRIFFCACALIDNIYIIGGCKSWEDFAPLNSCLEFSAKDNAWKEIAEMNQVRTIAACAVFQGKIVVCGGSLDGYEMEISNTVEVYDHVANSWSYMPNMTERRKFHSLVARKNKLFVFGGLDTNTFEVFDTFTERFVAVRFPEIFFEVFESPVAAAIGSKIFVFGAETSMVACYDVNENEWSENTCQLTKHIRSIFL